MGKYDKPDSQIDGQMTLEEYCETSKGLVAISRVFSRARREMNLQESKAFVFALSQLRFTEEAKSNIVYVDKKALADVVGVHSDPDHLSVDLNRSIGNLPKHSFIKIADKDLDLYDSGTVITRVTMLKNRVRIKFEEEYLRLFTGLSSNYITLWANDVYQMNNERSVQFYEYLRQITSPRQEENSVLLGVKALKTMFGIPEDAYMRDKGGFDRANFEKRVIDPICEDLKKTRMITLLTEPDGRAYEKIRKGRRVDGYKFYWSYTSHPGVATAAEVRELQERVDKDPAILQVAKNLLKGEKKKTGKKNQFTDFNQNDYDWAQLESELLGE